MQKVSKIILAVGVISALTASVFADSFINGGFEAGNLTGWTLKSGDWNASLVQTTNNAYQGDSAVITDNTLKDANTGGNLYEVLQGNDALRLNNPANGAHFSTLSQTVSNYTSSDMYFGFAAVLEDPTNGGHTEQQTPQFRFSIQDVSKGITLYDIQFDSVNGGSQGIAWHTGETVTGSNSGIWKYTDWNVIHIDTSLLSGLNGDEFTINVAAYDCALGGHGGYAYVDSFQPDLPVPNHGTVTVFDANVVANPPASVPEPTSIVLWSLGGLALLWGGKRRLFNPQS